MSNVNGHTLSAAFECLRLAAVYRCDYCPPDLACGLFGDSFDDSRDECHHTLDLDAAKAILLLRDAVPEMLEQRREIERLRAEVEMLRGVGCMEGADGPCGCCVKCYKFEIERLRSLLSDAQRRADALRRGCS